IAAKCCLIVEVDVKGCKIDKRQVQILRRRVVRIGHQAVRVRLPGDVRQLFEELLDATSAMPPDNVRRNLVADAVSHHRGVISAALAGLAYCFASVSLSLLAIEKA